VPTKAPGMILIMFFMIVVIVAIIAIAIKVAQGSGKEIEAPTVSHESSVDQIRKLSELRDAGIITEVEFAAKKDELLRRL
jgi:uncharacterized membrane protein